MLTLIGRDVHRVSVDESNITLEVVATLPSEVQCAACVAPDVLYFVPCTDLCQLMVWRYKDMTSSPTCVAQWPHAARNIMYHRHKLYGVARDEARLMIYDPLCGVTEAHTTLWCACAMASAGDGVALQDAEGHVCVYDVNTCTARVVICGDASLPSLCLLGSYKQYAVVRDGDDERGDVRDGSDTATRLSLPAQRPPPHAASTASSLYLVNELGVAVPLRDTTLPHYPFVLLDDVVAVYVDKYAGALATTRRQHSCQLRATELASLLLCAVVSQSGDEACTLCLCDVEPGDSLTLDCGHRFHTACTEEWVRTWDAFRERGGHITFTRARCPGGCRRLVRHPCIAASRDIQALHAAVMAVTATALTAAEPTRTADDVLTYVCHTCGRPFWGGDRVCTRMLTSEPVNAPSSLLCEDCARDFVCAQHGRQFVVYKCRYCCNPATQRSFATRYLCERCNARWSGAAEPTLLPCPGAEQCPLHGRHDNDGDTHVIGCLVCLPRDALALDKVALPPPSSPAPGGMDTST